MGKNKYRVVSEVIPGVYAIVNKVNGHMYVGSSFDVYGRWSKHQQDLVKNTHHSDYFQKAWNKYHKDNFDFIVLERVDGDIKKDLQQNKDGLIIIWSKASFCII